MVYYFAATSPGRREVVIQYRRVSANPYEALTEHELLVKLEKSREHATQGMYKDAAEVSYYMRSKYGL